MGPRPAKALTVMTERTASMVDVGFALDGGSLPRDHRCALADALESSLPWLAGLPGAGMHRLKFPAGEGPDLLLSRRTRLRLRVPRERAADAAALAGSELQVCNRRLRVDSPKQRELLPHGTLYAHLVASEGADEQSFLEAMQSELKRLGVTCRPICGRRQVCEGGMVQGYSLMLDGLTVEDSLRVQESGLGAHRRLGCGVFVAHRSAAAVGARQ
jgi:CRISPR-associated protein Cas6